MPDGPGQEARDKIFLSQLGKTLEGPFPSRWTCPEVQPWLYGYDAFEEVSRAIEREPFQEEETAVSPLHGDGFSLGRSAGCQDERTVAEQVVRG